MLALLGCASRSGRLNIRKGNARGGGWGARSLYLSETLPLTVSFVTPELCSCFRYDAGLGEALLTRKWNPPGDLWVSGQEHGFQKRSMRRVSLGTGGDTEAEPLEQQELPPLGLTLETSPRSKCLEAKPPRPAGSESRHYALCFQGAQEPESMPDLTRGQTLGPEPGQTGAQGCMLARKPSRQNTQRGPGGPALSDEEPGTMGWRKGQRSSAKHVWKGKPVPKHVATGYPQLQAPALRLHSRPWDAAIHQGALFRTGSRTGAGRYLGCLATLPR